MTSLTLFKYKFDYRLLNIVILACRDNILAVVGLSLTKCVSIFDDYLERILVRCDYTAKSNIWHKIYEACLSFSILSIFTRVNERTETASLIIKGVLSSPWKFFKHANTLACNYFNMPVVLMVLILTRGKV